MKKKIVFFIILVTAILISTAYVGGNKTPIFNSNEIELSNLNSTSGVLIDLSKDEVLYQQNANKKVYPASLTKIMTTIVALEELNNLDHRVAVKSEVINRLIAQQSSMAGFYSGEMASVRSLLYATLLSSGGDAAVTLATEIAGSEEGFADLMNDKAQELGMKSTHFANATGLHDDKNYSTAKDISILLRYALMNDDFRWIFTSESYTDEHRTYTSTLFSDINKEQDGYVILGGKTGYTPEAGLCLASIAKKDGVEYMFVTLGAQGDKNSEPNHVLDAQNAYSNVNTLK